MPRESSSPELVGSSVPEFDSDGFDAYADLVLQVGQVFRSGRDLVIWASVDHVPFVRALARCAYKSGARSVETRYSDLKLTRSQIEFGSDEGLGWTPPWMLHHVEDIAERQVSLVNIVSPDPDVLAGLSGARIVRAQRRQLREAEARLMNGDAITWTVAAFPTEQWAAKVFGGSEVRRLWAAICRAVRLDEADPLAKWRAHLDCLQLRAQELTERRFDALRYRGRGTDLTIGLLPDSLWIGGATETDDGRRFVPNLPTEETFTTPDSRRCDGVVRATRPVVLSTGTVVDGLELRFSNGRVTQARASSGEDELRGQLAFDAGASMVGEVALVDSSSRVGRLGIVFYHLLLDENALPHLALGNAYRRAAGDLSDGLSVQELKERGVNQSALHTDIMIGDTDVEIFGVERGGTVVPLLQGGEWQLH